MMRQSSHLVAQPWHSDRVMTEAARVTPSLIIG